MTGRGKVHSLRQRLDAVFKRAEGIGLNTELQSDLARHLCVLVSGYIEKAVAELVQEHARQVGGPTLERFVERRTCRFTNPKSKKIWELLGNFDPEWQQKLSNSLGDKRKTALDSIVNLRNKIAHGESVGATYMQIRDYYLQVQQVVELVADICVPLKVG